MNAAFVEADRLLRSKYDPERATASTFLSKWLFGRTSYRILVEHGKKKRSEGWKPTSTTIREDAEDTVDRRRGRSASPGESVELEDLIEAIHPDLRSVVRRLADGYTIEEIIREDQSAPLFDSRDTSDDAEVARDELLMMLRGFIRRITR